MCIIIILELSNTMSSRELAIYMQVNCLHSEAENEFQEVVYMYIHSLVVKCQLYCFYSSNLVTCLQDYIAGRYQSSHEFGCIRL